jgi:hypothetical protein
MNVTGWIIAGVIAAFFALVLATTVHIRVSYREDGPRVWVGFWWFRFRLYPPKPKKEKKPKAKPEKQPKEPPKEEPKPEKKQKLDFELVKNLVSSGFKGLGVLFRHLKFKMFLLRIVVGSEDAAECAIQYGRICAAVHGGLAVASNLVHLKAKEISIDCDFKRNETELELDAQAGIRIVFVFGAAFSMLFRFAANTIRNNNTNRKV